MNDLELLHSLKSVPESGHIYSIQTYFAQIFKLGFNVSKEVSTWDKEEVFREEARAGWSYFCPICGSMDESVGYVLVECEELSECANEVYGDLGLMGDG